MKLRGKLLLVSLSLLVLPWAGWQFLRLMGEVLREGDESSLRASAEAIARGLAQRPAVLPPAGPSIFAAPLHRRLTLDGRDDDWVGDRPEPKQLGDERAGFSAQLGVFDDTFFAQIDVVDATPQRTDAHWPVADRRDHVQLTLHGRQGVVGMRIANRTSGPAIVTALDGTLAPLRVSGEWLEKPDGYSLELAFPHGYTLRAISIVVQDVDTEEHVQRFDSTQLSGGQPWQVISPSEALANSLQQLVPVGLHAQVIDREGWRLAEAGDLDRPASRGAVPAWRRWLHNSLLFGDATQQPPRDERSLRLQGPDIDRALAGDISAQWRRDDENQRLIGSVAVPVTVAKQTRGVLKLQRESDATMRLADRAFSGLFGTTLLALAIVVIALVVFATRLSNRIRRLRDAAENALDREGRVRSFPASTARDEIGDLSRSFAKLIDEVATYTGYLRGLSGTLSHEINTPIAIVRTSLENLEAEPNRDDARIYIERARVGIDRLGTLVRAMSEASRMEQAIESADVETIDLRQLVVDCGESYRALLAPRTFALDVPPSPVPFRCAPDLIAQALDKLIDNARGFCPLEGQVRLSLSFSGSRARLSVANSGPLLPESMQGRLFDSMVSVRERKAGETVHLGLGLYVVKLIARLHGGDVEAANLKDDSGVEFVMHLVPIERAVQRSDESQRS